MMGWVWLHHCKVYKSKFNERTPPWLDTFKLQDRLPILIMACELNWRLPSDWIPDEAVDNTQVKPPERK